MYFKKRNLRLREQAFEGSRHSRAEIGEIDVIGQKISKDDKSALKTLKNGYSAIKTMSISKIRGNSKKGSSKSKKKLEPCKTPKSDDSGGFRERFQLRRHLSTSTLDANTKVKDWITNELLHRCSPHILMKSNTDLQTEKQLTITKPFTRSEELLSDSKKPKKDIKDASTVGGTRPTTLPSKSSNKTRTSEKTTSTSALGSHSSIASNKESVVSKQTGKSNESLKSKGTDSTKSQKVSVAIDATPAARTNSILSQVPIEISKSFDCNEPKHSNEEKLQRSKTESAKVTIEMKPNNYEKQKFTNEVTLSVGTTSGLKVSHKHSTSDPVTDVNYDKIIQEKIENGECLINILPPVTFRNDINVTSRDEKQDKALTAAEALLTIQRRNYPKVLPDLPKAQKRLSLQPTTLQTFRNYVGGGECQVERLKVPPQPPPRTTTLERRLAYKNTKPLSSFDSKNVKKISEADTTSRNYENIDTLSPQTEFNRSFNKCSERSPSMNNEIDPVIVVLPKEREYPKVIIASSDIPLSRTPEPKIVIQPSPSQVEIPLNAPRVRLPDDFHSHSQTGSVTSFSSFCSEDDDDIDDEFLDELAENQLINELVGGVESPTDIDQLDSKGPETIFEKKLEIVPVKINPGYLAPKNKEDYVCISSLHLPDMSDFEKTAKIKPNFGLNKLQQRSESIHKPLEMTVKVKQKKKKPSTLLNNSLKGKRKSDKCKSDSTKLEHSTSGSSNDTETSTGTVRQVLVKK